MVFKFKAGHAGSQKFCWPHLLLLAALLGLQGCDGRPGNPTNITDLQFSGFSQRPHPSCDGLDPHERRNCTPALQESLRFAEIGKAIIIHPVGTGPCPQASVDFGDGTPPLTLINPAVGTVGTLVQVPHTYNGWPGKKLIRVKGENGCLGDVTKEITVGIGSDGHEDFTLALCFGPRCRPSVPITSVCNFVTRPTGFMPAIRTGTGVRIVTDGGAINYGSNQIFNASGNPLLPTSPQGYAFPGMRKFSLVYRIGSQAVQGEAGSVVFIANNTAPLEICANDNPGLLADNAGAMRLDITVNERSAR